MQPFAPTSQTFTQDQVWDYTITNWDTPFTALEGGVASAGLVFDLVEPVDGTSASWKQFVDAMKAVSTNVSALSTFTGSTAVRQQISNGRTDNMVGYWAAGAPGQHGATVSGKVAYHFRGYLRAPAARAFFSSATTPSWFLALAGNGYFRVDKTVAGTTTTIFRGSVTEKDYLVNGFTLTPQIADMQQGDYLDIYYIQTGAETWGGFVVKAVGYTLSTDATANQTYAAAAPILGCALLDDGAPPTPTVLHSTKAITVEAKRKSPMTAEFTLPLINKSATDGTGWEWFRSTSDDPGYLQLWDGGVPLMTLHRKRLIQIKKGFAGELYTVFTGFVEDFSQPSTGTVTVTCRGFESRLLEQHDKNYPDQISYMARGFKRTSVSAGTNEPIYPIPAYDNWPVEYAISDLMVRNGVDASRLIRPFTVPNPDGTSTPVVYGSTVYKFRARTLNNVLLRMDRPVHYGNAGSGFTETLPADDAYLFKPDVTKEVWNRSLEMCERLGYELRFDAFGDAVLMPRNNPAYVYDLVPADATGAPTNKTHPSAYAAKYLEWTGSTASVTKAVTGARIDLSVPLGPTLGQWTYTVANGVGTVVASGSINPTGASTSLFFYDGALNADATNATVVTLYSGDYGTYTVTLTASGGSATRRLDCLFVYHTDPLKPRYPSTFSTAANALKVQAQSAMDDMRNSVIVVGARKAAVTDSDKFPTNPNNPEAEFIVERVVDKASITDKSAPNYVGAVKESIIYDSSITDNAYARYLARVFIYRYRNPKPPVSIEHTLVPMLDLLDPIYAEEKRNDSVGVAPDDPRKSVLWVTGYKHTIDGKRATTSITTSSFPDFPAFEPREDIDLSAFNGKPVVNVAVSYTSLDGVVKTNVGPTAPYLCVDRLSASDSVSDWVTVNGLVPSANTLTIPQSDLYGWPPVPGTVFIKPVFNNPGYDNATDVTTANNYYEKITRGGSLRAIKMPYQIGVVSVSVDVNGLGTPAPVYLFPTNSRTVGTNRATSEFYYTISDEDVLTISGGDLLTKTVSAYGTATWKLGHTDTKLGWVTNNPYHHFFNVDYRVSNRKISLVWNQGDNTSLMYQRAAADSYSVKYRRLGPVDGTGAFSDPYASAGGCPFFDPYTSELGYTVGVTADVLVSGLYRVSVRNVDDDTVVAWLTEPTADPQKQEAHWQYLPAGAGKVFAWDGVDNLGIWNRKQSVQYAASVSGVFDEGTRDIGAGFYVWNREDGPLALVSGQRDSNTGEPIFGHGTFAQWYVYIECKTDTVNTVVRTDALDTANNNGSAAALIYTHLPEPTKAEVAIADWTSSTDYNANDVSTTSAASALNPANWGAVGTDAVINNQKPVRLRFRVPQRPGTLWTGFASETTVKLTRHAHLRANIHDQFVVYNGTNWPGSSFEDTAIYTRRLTNDEHTLKYTDDNYRKASSLKWADTDLGTEWVFTPSLFQKSFRGYLEAIQFGDYLQLEELPKWDEGQRHTVAGARSRMQLAFMNYLFYLSGYVSDRSGRSVWAVNRSFLDQSKICNNAYGDWWDPAAPGTAATSSTYQTPWPDDPMLQHRRTIVTRQWSDEKVNGTLWTSAQKTRFNIPNGSIGAALLRHKWGEHSPNSTTIAGTAWSSFPATELELDNYTTWHTTRTGSGTPTAPKIVDTAYNNLTRQLKSLGSGCLWTWEVQPTWTPCITRDFHGYRLLPPMVDDPGLRNSNHNYEGGVYQIVDMRKYQNTTKNLNTGADAAAGETWASAIYDQTEPYDSSDNGRVRFWPGTQVSLTEDPTKSKGVAVNSVNYVRQDELVHWEDLRGMFSRGRRPSEAPIKVTPVQPYYQNLYTYQNLVRWTNWNADTYPFWMANVTDWFRMSFRSEYYWESGTFFPTTEHGAERLDYLNASKTRFMPTPSTNTIRYDDGAYVGWKDDRASGTDAYTNNKVGQVSMGFYTGTATGGRVLTPFESDTQVAAIGPKLAQTMDMLFHMVLVPERRSSPV